MPCCSLSEEEKENFRIIMRPEMVTHFTEGRLCHWSKVANGDKYQHCLVPSTRIKMLGEEYRCGKTAFCPVIAAAYPEHRASMTKSYAQATNPKG